MIIRLQALSFDLLVTLVRAAPGLLSFEQLGERVWPGLVVTPETIVQRVKLLRSALGDDAHAPRYIEGVRGRGYRMVADVRPLTERQGDPESIVPPSLKEPGEEESPDGHARTAVTGAAGASSPTETSPAIHDSADWWRRLGWVGGTVIMVVLLAAAWALIRYRRVGQPVEPASARMGPPAIRSLAVLPLQNLSGDKEEEYFADGMTDALTTDLAEIGSLRVISRTSAMHFKDSNETLPQIGHDLHVDAVVEGAVTRGENRVRVTAQLVEASSDRHLWARAYERELKDALVLQDEIAHDIAEQIRVQLTPNNRSRLLPVHAADPEAQDAYLRGRYWASKTWIWSTCIPAKCVSHEARKALEYYQQAIAKDPSYALGYAGVADGFVALALSGDLSFQEAAPQINAAATRALALNSELAEPHLSLAYVKLLNDWDWSGAEAEFKRSIALNPNFAEAHRGYSIYLVIMGRLEEAVNESERACALDPFGFWANEWLGQALYHARRYDDALRQIRRSLEMFPGRRKLNWELGDVYEQKKMFAEAFDARQQALALVNDPHLAELGEAYKRGGYRGWLLKEVQYLNQLQTPHNYTVFPMLAHLYAKLGDESDATNYLERGYEEHSPAVLFMGTAPELDSIRSSPRFQDLLRRIGLPPLDRPQTAVEPVSPSK